MAVRSETIGNRGVGDLLKKAVLGSKLRGDGPTFSLSPTGLSHPSRVAKGGYGAARGDRVALRQMSLKGGYSGLQPAQSSHLLAISYLYVRSGTYQVDLTPVKSTLVGFLCTG